MTTYKSMREAAKRKLQHYDSKAAPNFEGKAGTKNAANKGQEKPVNKEGKNRA